MLIYGGLKELTNALSDGTIGTKAHKILGKVAVGVVTQGVQKIFRAPICRAHCAVIFAIAQLSYIYLLTYLLIYWLLWSAYHLPRT